MPLNRRAFIRGSALTLGSAWSLRRLPRAGATPPAAWDRKRLEHFRIWDLHGHLTGVGGTPAERIRWILRYARRLGIERVVFFMGLQFRRDPAPREFRRDNDDLMHALDAAGQGALGFVYLNPKYPEESLQELDRCVRDGPLVGVKLWVATRATAAGVLAIVRRAVELQVPVYQHTWYKTTGNLPGESTPEDAARLAALCPQAKIIAGHTGGQWELGIRAIRRRENLWAGLGGSDPTAGMAEMAVRELGARRVLYGSDCPGRSFASQLAKVLGAEIAPEEKRLILGANLRRLLAPALAAKGISIEP